MKEYDLIFVGVSSGIDLIQSFIELYPNSKIAVIDKELPGGISIIKSHAPTKMLMHSAEILKTLNDSKLFGIDLKIKKINFQKITKHIKKIVTVEAQEIQKNLINSENIDYYPGIAEFTAPYQLRISEHKNHNKTNTGMK